MKTHSLKKYFALRYFSIALLSAVLFTACSKKENNPKDEDPKKGAHISATFQFNQGKAVDFTFTSQKDDLIKPAFNGPNGNNHYKLWLRGEKSIDGMIYTINIYVTAPAEAVGTYPFGSAWQWHDEGFVTEIHVGVQDADNLMNLKQYVSTPPAVDNSNSKGVSISSFANNHIKGTFSGKAGYTETDVVTISNGTFNIDVNRGTWED